jgi:hypothetical protein
MSDISTYTKRDAFNEILYSLVEEYLNEKDAHPAETVLAINRKTKATKLGTKTEFTAGWELFPIDKLIRKNDEDETEEVDIDATFEIASSIYFVR